MGDNKGGYRWTGIHLFVSQLNCNRAKCPTPYHNKRKCAENYRNDSILVLSRVVRE